MPLPRLLGTGHKLISGAFNLHAVVPVIRHPSSGIAYSFSCSRFLHTAQGCLLNKIPTEAGDQGTEVWHIGHDTVVDGLNKRLINLLDVRRPDEIELLGNIPTAHNIPVEELESAFRLSDKEFEQHYNFSKPSSDGPVIVVYCRSGKRSERACQILQKFKYKNVGNFVGSWNEWSEKHPEDVRIHPISDKQG